DRDDEHRPREARPDAEDEVRLAEEVVDPLRPRQRARAEGERVVLGERALALERREDRNLGELGDRAELLPGLGVEDALAGDDDGRLRGEEHPDGLLDVVWVADRRRPAD